MNAFIVLITTCKKEKLNCAYLREISEQNIKDTHGHTSLHSQSSQDSTVIGDGTWSSPHADKLSCSWFWDGNTYTQEKAWTSI